MTAAIEPQGWIAIDLDGTLAEYNGWISEEHIGQPIPAMVERVQAWLAQGQDVRIFTARVNDTLPLKAVAPFDTKQPATVWVRRDQRVRAIIETWCVAHIGQVLPITNCKDYAMLELWDDRAVQVEANTGRLIGQSTRGL